MKSESEVVDGLPVWRSGESRRPSTLARASLAAILGAVTALTLGALTTVNAQAATPRILYVSQTGLDSGTCTSADPCATVTYALTHAPSGATIEVSGTIDDHATISSPVTITTWPGGPAGSPGVLDGTASGDVVSVGSAVAVTLNDMTVENGNYGVFNDGGTLTLTDSTVFGNKSVGVGSESPLTVIDSTITGNSSYGISSSDGASMTVIASTIAGNFGYGIYSGSGVATLGATIVADNTKGNCDPYDTSSFSSAGYNLTNDTTGTACSFNAATDLVNKSPLLGPLASNGGPTQTLLPASTSPAADVLPDPTTLRGVAVCPGTDQRGVTRPGTGETRCSIGAVEVGSTIPTSTSIRLIPTTVPFGTRVIYLVTVVPNSGTGTPTGKVTFKIGKAVLCKAVLSGGVAACGATTAPVGADTVTGRYLGGGGFAGSSSKASLTVTS